MLIPSIDLMNGKAVQLIQGKKKVLERENPINLAKEFNKYGEIAVIDLDAAFGQGNNYELIKKICSIADCRVGGGIRTIEKANEYLKAGAKKIIIGTKANPEFLKNFNKERIIVAVDFKNGFVVNKGWKNKTNITPFQLIKKLNNYCSEFLITDVNNEGTLSGISQKTLKLLKIIKKLTKNKITYAGGIKSIDDIKSLEQLNINAQLGMSIYTDKITLNDSFIELLKFNNDILIPTIVQDTNNQVLMLAYSNPDSLKKTFSANKATYYSRSRKKLWTKGEISGNTQEFISARWDCDKDALLFTVKQKNNACHQDIYSCFGNKNFDFDALFKILTQRKDSLKNKSIKNNSLKTRSYTQKLLKNKNLLKNKLIEEFNELLKAKTKDEIVWESSDLLYFLFVYLINNNVNLIEIKNELWRRSK